MAKRKLIRFSIDAFCRKSATRVNVAVLVIAMSCLHGARNHQDVLESPSVAQLGHFDEIG